LSHSKPLVLPISGIVTVYIGAPRMWKANVISWSM